MNIPVKIKRRIRKILYRIFRPIIKDVLIETLSNNDESNCIRSTVINVMTNESQLFRPIFIDSLKDIIMSGEKSNPIRSMLMNIINNEIRIWGSENRLKISSTAQMVNTLFNTSSGNIEVGDYTFTGHNVAIITGTHRYESFLDKRMIDVPPSGNDITIGNGVWLGTNAVILGPCKIGDHAVVAAGAVVINDVPPYTIVAGVPAKPIKVIKNCELTQDTVI